MKKPVNEILLDRQCAGSGNWPGVGCPEDHGCKEEIMFGEVRVPTDHLAHCQLFGKQGRTRVGPQGLGIYAVDMILYMSTNV